MWQLFLSRRAAVGYRTAQMKRHCAVFATVAMAFSLGCELSSSAPNSPAATAAPARVSGDLETVGAKIWPTLAKVQGSLFANEITVISAKVPGQVIEVNCDLGDSVAAGFTVIRIDPIEYQMRVSQANAQLSQARAAVGLKADAPVDTLDPFNSPPVREARAVLDEANQQVARLQQLVRQKAVVATELESALSQQSVAEARFNSALNSVREKIALIGVQAAQLALAEQQLAETEIIAPYPAEVVRRMVSPGSYVQTGSPLLQLAQTEVLRFRAAVPERLAQQIAIGQQVHVQVNGKNFETSVSRISPSIDPLSRSLMFEADVPNPNHELRSGIFAQADLVLDDQAQSISVPESALIRFAGIDKVWKVADGKVTEAVVEIGRNEDGLVEILSGLSSGDQILLNGAQGRVGAYEPSGKVLPVSESSETDDETQNGAKNDVARGT